jgi:hypothetical protein
MWIWGVRLSTLLMEIARNRWVNNRRPRLETKRIARPLRLVTRACPLGHRVVAKPGTVRRTAVKTISHSQWNARYVANTGPSRDDTCRPALRPEETIAIRTTIDRPRP